MKGRKMAQESTRTHTHVITSTTARLEDHLNDWLDPSQGTEADWQAVHTGGRDWVIVLRHLHDTDSHEGGE